MSPATPPPDGLDTIELDPETIASTLTESSAGHQLFEPTSTAETFRVRVLGIPDHPEPFYRRQMTWVVAAFCLIAVLFAYPRVATQELTTGPSLKATQVDPASPSGAAADSQDVPRESSSGGWFDTAKKYPSESTKKTGNPWTKPLAAAPTASADEQPVVLIDEVVEIEIDTGGNADRDDPVESETSCPESNPATTPIIGKPIVAKPCIAPNEAGVVVDQDPKTTAGTASDNKDSSDEDPNATTIGKSKPQKVLGKTVGGAGVAAKMPAKVNPPTKPKTTAAKSDQAVDTPERKPAPTTTTSSDVGKTEDKTEDPPAETTTTLDTSTDADSSDADPSDADPSDPDSSDSDSTDPDQTVITVEEEASETGGDADDEDGDEDEETGDEDEDGETGGGGSGPDSDPDAEASAPTISTLPFRGS